MSFSEKVAVVYPVGVDVDFSDYKDEIDPPPSDVSYLFDYFPVTIDVKFIVGVHLIMKEGVSYHIKAWVKDANGNRVKAIDGIEESISGERYFNICILKEKISYLMNYTIKNIHFERPGMYEIFVEIYPGTVEENPESTGAIHSNSAFIYMDNNPEEDGEEADGQQ